MNCGEFGLPRLPILIPAENYHNDLLGLATLVTFSAQAVTWGAGGAGGSETRPYCPILL